MTESGDEIVAPSVQQGSGDSTIGDGGDSVGGDRDERVAAAADRLGDIDGAPLHEQAEIYADVYARLNSAMVEVRAD